jgi:hypothetical protein
MRVSEYALTICSLFSHGIVIYQRSHEHEIEPIMHQIREEIILCTLFCDIRDENYDNGYLESSTVNIVPKTSFSIAAWNSFALHDITFLTVLSPPSTMSWWPSSSHAMRCTILLTLLPLRNRLSHSRWRYIRWP